MGFKSSRKSFGLTKSYSKTITAITYRHVEEGTCNIHLSAGMLYFLLRVQMVRLALLLTAQTL